MHIQMSFDLPSMELHALLLSTTSTSYVQNVLFFLNHRPTVLTKLRGNNVHRSAWVISQEAQDICVELWEFSQELKEKVLWTLIIK